MKKIVAIAAATLMVGSVSSVLAADGEQLYQTKPCRACHDVGVAGAPKLGDKEAWAPRLGQGLDAMLAHVQSGYSSKPGSMMPPKGTCMDCTDDELKAIIEYMTSKVQ